MVYLGILDRGVVVTWDAPNINKSVETKVCINCKHRKPKKDFNKKSSNKDGLERYCKDCHRLKNRKHYLENSDTYKAQAKKSRLAYVDWYKQLKATYACVDCGETKPWRLTFHHVDPSTKIEGVSAMITQKRPKKVILEEIEKCDCLCHNCHSDRHLEEFY